MRYNKFLIIYIFSIICCISGFGQDITGLWKGEIYNDTTQQSYRYEIGISNENGKMTGFSHTYYNDDKAYFVVKSLKVRKKQDKIIIEDVDIISYNYPEAPPKGVRRLHVLDLKEEDSLMTLTGRFETNRTRIYSPATGTVHLKKRNDFYKSSALVDKLKELKVENQISFAPDENKTLVEADRSLSKANTSVSTKRKKVTIERSIHRNESKNIAIVPVVLPSIPAAEVESRSIVLQETINFKSDSLQISLYDNGEVDGDTVSVLVNGKIIMAKQGLTTNAIRKTIYIDPGTDSVQLIMYAENLGSIAPNTGLLVIKDGRDSYEVRFSGDFQKNAAIIFKRKK